MTEVIPLEGRVDYLTLHTGKKIEVPFEQLLIFATNLDFKKLVDDAFLRRMGYRLYVTPPSKETYRAIFRDYVEAQGLEYDFTDLDYLLHRYETERRPLRCCEPRDLIQRCFDLCNYEKRPISVSKELLGLAWNNYLGTTG